ncbi:MAG: sterol desaturase family protein [Cyclobacteriaceae bacterium]
MEAYAKVLSYAIPGFVLLILVESIIGRRMGIQVNRPMDTISSLSSGMTNTLKSIIGLSLVIISYGWMEEQIGLLDIKSTWLVYMLAFIGLDFAGYWSHRFNHMVNVFWNRHIVHHSSEEFNLACALRQSISAFVSIYFFLYIPLALIGIPAQVVAVVAPLHLFAQFWYHTKLIGKMGFLEHIIVTPSHHRVHHAINPEYLDKNFSEIFIVWDKLFGTFQEEMPEVPAVYGTKRPSNTWNPIIINFMHIWMLMKDAWYTRNIWDKIRLWFMPTGWRPDDVKERFPVMSVEDVYNRPKYDTPSSGYFLAWSWFQLVVNNILLFYLLTQIAAYPFADMVLFSVFLFVSIFSYTTLMDGHRLAMVTEVVKFVMGLFLYFRFEGWYGIDEILPGGSYSMLAYLGLSLMATLYFSLTEFNQTKEISGQVA